MKNEELTREELRQKTLKFIDVIENKVTDVESIHWFLNIDSSPFWRYIRELVEDYDPDTAMWMDKYHEARVENAKLRKQLDEKPKVSREEIEGVMSIGKYYPISMKNLTDWLKSKGIEVEE